MKRDASMSSEWKLLLFLAAGRLTPGAEDQVRALLARSLDWSGFLGLAHRHGVYPLVTRNLENSGIPGVPSDVWLALQQACRRNAVRGRL